MSQVAMADTSGASLLLQMGSCGALRPASAEPARSNAPWRPLTRPSSASGFPNARSSPKMDDGRSRPRSATVSPSHSLSALASPMAPRAYEALAQRVTRANKISGRGYHLGGAGNIVLKAPPAKLSVNWPGETPSLMAVSSSPVGVASPAGASHLRRVMSAHGKTAGAAWHQPPTRRDAVLLCAWLQERLAALEEGEEEAALVLWDDAMLEVVRQVSVACAERGRLLDLCRLRYLEQIARLRERATEREEAIVARERAAAATATAAAAAVYAATSVARRLDEDDSDDDDGAAAVSLSSTARRGTLGAMPFGPPISPIRPDSSPALRTGGRARQAEKVLLGRLEARLDHLCRQTLATVAPAAPGSSNLGSGTRSRSAAEAAARPASRSVKPEPRSLRDQGIRRAHVGL